MGRIPKCSEMRSELADLFSVVAARFEDPSNITPVRYFWIDATVERLFILRHFLIRFEDTANGGTGHQKVADREGELVDLLKQKPWTALDKARRLRRQIDAGIYASDLEDDMRKGGVLIGFGADTIKNLLTQQPQRAAGGG